MSGKISRGIAQRPHLGMAGRVPVDLHAARAQPDDPTVLHHHGAIGLIARGECLVTHRRGLGGEVTLISRRAQHPVGAGNHSGKSDTEPSHGALPAQHLS